MDGGFDGALEVLEGAMLSENSHSQKPLFGGRNPFVVVQEVY
jgi:hypothetical protein